MVGWLITVFVCLCIIKVQTDEILKERANFRRLMRKNDALMSELVALETKVQEQMGYENQCG